MSNTKLISTDHQDFIDFKSDLEMGKVFYKDIVVKRWKEKESRRRFDFFRGAYLFSNEDQSDEIGFLMEIAMILREMELGI